MMVFIVINQPEAGEFNKPIVKTINKHFTINSNLSMCLKVINFSD